MAQQPPVPLFGKHPDGRLGQQSPFPFTFGASHPDPVSHRILSSTHSTSSPNNSSIALNRELPGKEPLSLRFHPGDGVDNELLARSSPQVCQGLIKQEETLSSRDSDKILLQVGNISSHSHIASKECKEKVSQTNMTEDDAPLGGFYTVSFQENLIQGTEISNEMLQALIQASKQSSTMKADLERLLDDTRNLCQNQTVDSHIVAVIGDSGQGKSSLINSLLEVPEISKTGDLGRACTSVITEYRQKQPGQSAPIIIEAEYVPQEEIKTYLEELVWSYRKLHIADKDIQEASRDGDRTHVINDQDYAALEREAEYAWSALEAAFQHQPRFNRDLLLAELRNPAAPAVAQLCAWAQELDWPQGGSGGKWSSTAASADECCERIGIFMSDKFWPFTKVLRIYVDAKILRSGIVIADLPGLQDTNLARVRLTETYMLKSNHILLVCNIARAITDASLKSSIFKVISRHIPQEWEESAGKSLKLAVVCTRTDDINLETNRKEFVGDNKPICERHMIDLEREFANAVQAGDHNLAKSWKLKKKALLIQARNAHVTTGLQAAYASKVPGGKLEVFCISSRYYKKYSTSSEATYLQMSGISPLRRFCRTLTASTRLHQAKYYLNCKIPSVLNSVELCVNSQAVSRTRSEDEDIMRARLAMHHSIVRTVDGLGPILDQEYQDNAFIMLNRRNEIWENEAEKRAAGWLSWHWTQYNAWISHNGAHQTPNRGYVDWNAEMIWKQRIEMDYVWEILLNDSIPDAFEALSDTIETEIMTFSNLASEQELPATLSELLVLRKRTMQSLVMEAQDELVSKVQFVRRKASEPNATSYILEEMRPTYRKAATIYGTGKKAAQHRTVHGHITSGTLFPSLGNKIIVNIRSATNTNVALLQKNIRSVLGTISLDLDSTLAASTRLRSMQSTEEHHRQQLAGVVAGLKERLAKILEDIKDVE